MVWDHAQVGSTPTSLTHGARALHHRSRACAAERVDASIRSSVWPERLTCNQLVVGSNPTGCSQSASLSTTPRGLRWKERWVHGDACTKVAALFCKESVVSSILTVSKWAAQGGVMVGHLYMSRSRYSRRWGSPPSWFKKLQRQRRRSQTRQAIREGREPPRFRREDRWLWW